MMFFYNMLKGYSFYYFASIDYLSREDSSSDFSWDVSFLIIDWRNEWMWQEFFHFDFFKSYSNIQILKPDPERYILIVSDEVC